MADNPRGGCGWLMNPGALTVEGVDLAGRGNAFEVRPSLRDI